MSHGSLKSQDFDLTLSVRQSMRRTVIFFYQWGWIIQSDAHLCSVTKGCSQGVTALSQW